MSVTKFCCKKKAFKIGIYFLYKQEVDRVGVAVMQHLTERQRAHAKHAEHSRKLDDVSTALNRIRLHINQSLNIADELNMLLPEEQRLPSLKLF